MPESEVIAVTPVIASPQEVSSPPGQSWRDWIAPLKRLLGGPIGATLGGLGFASWAAWANWDAGWTQALRSAAGQFWVSALLTWGDARVMDWLFHRFERRWVGGAVAATGSLIGSYSLVISVHCLLGTPHILLTLLPGVLPTLAYTIIYMTLLVHGRSQRHFSPE